MPEPLVVVPDDFPSVFEGTPAHERLKKLGEARVYTARGAEDEAELIRRIDGARAIINIRAHARFTDHVAGRPEWVLALGEQLDEPGVPAEELRELLDAQLPR